MRKLLALVTFAVLCPLVMAQQALNNDGVVKLVKAGLSESLVIDTINASPANYDTSANGLIGLKTAGVDDKEIAAIVLKASGASSAPTPAAAPSPSAVPPGVDSIGVYYQAKDGTWQEVNSEVVNMENGGVLKSFMTHGIIKGDINGHLKGTESRLRLTLPAKFILYVPEGRSPGEYELIRFRVNKDSREFRSMTGGVVHYKTGAARDSVDFDSKKIAPRIYEIQLKQDLGKGEYGLLPPADTGNLGNVASQGKIYTFSILE